MWLGIACAIVGGLVVVTVLGALIYFEIEFRLALRRLPKERRARREALRRLRGPEYPSDEFEGRAGVPPEVGM
ncbi:hypothetical protein ACFXHA_23420 [Nocardia sp. NPDC059240]|uniref:hypothetical protein n=1 Tax=Nocardia sp. NPDC059240 TaxID=3346786 RepID=UPI0036D00A41